jgi:hypothetical protein
MKFYIRDRKTHQVPWAVLGLHSLKEALAILTFRLSPQHYEIVIYE